MGVHETAGLDDQGWREIVAHYQRPDTTRAVVQLATTLVPLIASFAIMYRLLAVSLWWTLLRRPDGWPARANVHPHARLRSWVLLCLAAGQSSRRCSYWFAHTHALRSVAT